MENTRIKKEITDSSNKIVQNGKWKEYKSKYFHYGKNTLKLLTLVLEKITE